LFDGLCQLHELGFILHSPHGPGSSSKIFWMTVSLVFLPCLGRDGHSVAQHVHADAFHLLWRDERNSDQKELTIPAPFKIVRHHEGFSAAGADFLRRKDARPATSDATADAMELMVLA
jgi:hypothetical protein